MTTAQTPSILTIAGSDPSGGAGIQADLKTFTALSSYGMSVVTALTAQNTQGVTGVHEIPAQFVGDQLTSVVSDIPPQAIKTGMLCSATIIGSLASSLRSLYPAPASLPPVVIDPVTISTSGHTLLPTSAITALKAQIIPLGFVLTPNVLEAEMLLSDEGAHGEGLAAKSKTLAEGQRRITDLGAMLASAKDLAGLGCPNVLLKGGHLALGLPVVKAQLRALQQAGALGPDDVFWPEDEGIRILKSINGSSPDEKVVVDVLWESAAAKCTAIVSRLIPTKNTHGTGCTLSAALAVYLGKGLSVRDATVLAHHYVRKSIGTSYDLGTGHGPLNHIQSITYRPLPPPTKANPQPFTTHLINSVKPIWDKYINHPFVLQLGQGTLDERKFAHYLRQDWLYLRHYARAHGLLSAKATTFDDITAFSGIALHVGRESNMHVAFCESFGISLADLHATAEAPGTSAYALYILDVGQRGNLLDLMLAVASCCLGYGEVGLLLQERIANGEGAYHLEGNPYKQWILDYSGDEYQNAVKASVASLERRIAVEAPTEARLAELVKIWEDCTRLEVGFWDGAMNLEFEDL